MTQTKSIRECNELLQKDLGNTAMDIEDFHAERDTAIEVYREMGIINRGFVVVPHLARVNPILVIHDDLIRKPLVVPPARKI